MTDFSSRQQQLSKKTLHISCVVPIHNEAEGITAFLTALQSKLATLTKHYEILIIDDGSKDDSVAKIEPLLKDSHLKLISFSRHFGKEHALTAGLEYSSGDVTLLIDADFQHPIELLPNFLQQWALGYDMVYGIRQDRANETWLKRNFTKLFYRLMRFLTKTNIPPNAGDFRLLDKCVVAALNQIEERGRFMKGLYAWVGFKSVAVTFNPPKRKTGKSSWKIGALAELALTGITAFSDIPLKIWGVLGLAISTVSLIYALCIVISTMIHGVDLPGFATLAAAIMFFGGIQLLSIGILGEYIARIFHEVKRRPKYIIARKYGLD